MELQTASTADPGDGAAPIPLATDAPQLVYREPGGPAWGVTLAVLGCEAGARVTPGRAPDADEPSAQLLRDCGAEHLTRRLRSDRRRPRPHLARGREGDESPGLGRPPCGGDAVPFSGRVAGRCEDAVASGREGPLSGEDGSRVVRCLRARDTHLEPCGARGPARLRGALTRQQAGTRNPFRKA